MKVRDLIEVLRKVKNPEREINIVYIGDYDFDYTYGDIQCFREDGKYFEIILDGVDVKNLL